MGSGVSPRHLGSLDMTVRDYYRHARSLGFGAEDCLRLARQAVAADMAARRARLPPPGSASHEFMPDGSGHIKLSFSITVF